MNQELVAGSLAELECVIERGLQTFVEVGQALSQISERKLYQEQGHATFEEYCKSRWGWTRGNAYHYIHAAEVVENVYSSIQKSGQPTLTQARELASLAPAQQREVAERVDFENTTVSELKEIIQEVRGPREDTQPVIEESEVKPKLAVHFSSDSPEWYTPPEVIERSVQALGGGIDLDPCSNTIGEPNIPATARYTEAHNGLERKWGGRVYMNPPYGRGIDAWAEKLCAEFASGNVTEAIALVPARVDTDWFRRFRDHAVCFIDGRLKFSGHDNSAPFPSAVIYLGSNLERFSDAFADMGDIWVRWHRE